MLGAAAHTTLPIPKAANPNRYDERAPSRSRAALTVVAAITDPTRYRVVTHAYRRSPPMSAMAFGSRLIVRNSLIAYRDPAGEQRRGAQKSRTEQRAPTAGQCCAIG